VSGETISLLVCLSLVVDSVKVIYIKDTHTGIYVENNQQNALNSVHFVSYSLHIRECTL
jgi:hypothetical protein